MPEELTPAGQRSAGQPQPLTPDQVAVLSEARNDRLQLEGKRFALDTAVGRIEARQAVYDFLSALVAIWLLLVLWGVRYLIPAGPAQEWTDRIATVIGTVLSFAVLSMTIWSWRAEWSGQIEKKRDLSRRARELIAEFEEIRGEPQFDQGKVESWRRKRVSFEDDLSHRLARFSVRCRQLGHQHVAMRHHREIPILCQMCNREWEPRFARLSRTWRSFFRGCEGCGIQFEGDQRSKS